MHPPSFLPSHLLSDWPECTLELRCPCSPRIVQMPVRWMIAQRGDQPFAGVLAALRCSTCRGKPAPVYLVAGSPRTFCGGPPPDWSLELVPAPG